MGNSSSSAHKISAQDKAILDLKNQRDKLHQYQKRIETLTAREHELAREALARQDRARAKLALRRKKYQETLLSRTDQQLQQLELLTQDVEFALVQKDIVFGLQQGAGVLREIRREMGGLEGVERLVGQSEDERRFQDDVGELLSGKLSAQDEDEVDDELEALRLGARAPLPDAPAAAPLPDAPLRDPAPAKAHAEDEDPVAMPA